MKQNKMKIESISIGLASPVRIRKQAERTLPNGKKIGQITTSKTVDYKTFKPEPEGLFCEKIFGPVNDFECSCGIKMKKVKNQLQFCPNCDIELTTSRVRRYRLGYIQLVSPVTHIWYLKGRPSFLSLLLNKKRKKVESLIYYTRSIYIPIHSLTKTSSTEINNSCKNPTKISLINQYYSNKYMRNFCRNDMFKTQINTVFCKFNYDFSKPTFLKTKSKQTDQTTATKKKIFLNKKIKYSKNAVKKKIEKKMGNFAALPGFVKKKKATKLKTWEEKKNSNTSRHFFQNIPNSNKFHFYRTIKQKNKSKNFSNLTEINDKDFSFNIKEKLLMPYPISLKCHWADEWDIQPDTKIERPDKETVTLIGYSIDEWRMVFKYLTLDSTCYDIGIPFYINRIVNQSFVVNGINYKYLSGLLTGTKAIWYLLRNINVPLAKQYHRRQLKKLNKRIKRFEEAEFLYKFQQRILKKCYKIRLANIRRLKVIMCCHRAKFRPEWLILPVLPVLPPDLRPIIQLDGNQTAVSDLNQLYKRVLDRNKRVEITLKTYPTYSWEVRYNQRLLQEAVDSLIANGKGGTPLASAPNGRAFKSLSDILKGKKGRFRLNLLGKRVDYSGRSVIVVGPELKLHQCGLPKEMAVELFQPYIVYELRKNNTETTIVKAKKLIHEQNPIIWKILKKILRTHPILLNRAPTLHRLGIQAFQAKLVEGRAILLHPLVCTAFNADFDGDQMAVHIPLSFQARAEAWKLLWSRNNILSPATGDPVIVPSQDMVLGCYYLTTNIHDNVPALISPDFANLNNEKYKFKQPSISSTKASNENQKKSKLIHFNSTKLNFLHLQLSNYFSSLDEVLIAFKQKKISIHSLIWVRWVDFVQVENFYEKPLEVRIDWYGNTIQVYSKYWRSIDKESNQISQFICTTPGRVLLNKTILRG